ncbi:GIY-YIG nuclease family protein [Sphingobacterium sp. xlx-130]|uniref:GIY-YIG nuclease family protein n=1 Tax=Sphingobacterium sp. xlx-130 TaxID=2654323 RepID=UPI0013DC7AA3|nr:GIY-YIG nuclease family protein [Sphingobacterium sp. xlx-130]
MDKFTADFLNKHKIDKKYVIDAKGVTINDIKAQMKTNNKYFAYNSTKCKQGGHTIRSRSGHCIVCDVTRIAFVKRQYAVGKIYVFGSKSKQFVKVGMTTDHITSRLQKLNSRKVGGANDWEALCSLDVEDPNNMELSLHKLLKDYRVTGALYEGTESKEIFRCSIFKVLDLINDYLVSKGVEGVISKDYSGILSDFNFKNLRSI